MANIVIYADQRHRFNDALYAWDRDRPSQPNSIVHASVMPIENGPSPEDQYTYLGVPDAFLEVMKAKGIAFNIAT